VATLSAVRRKNAGTLSASQWVLLLIAVTLAARLAFAGSLGLGVDEAYSVATARTFALSTYDHPPLSWWLAGAASSLFGTESALVVRLPFILLFALTTWLMFALARLLFGERAGLFAALTLNLAPVLAWTTGSFVLPDGPLIAALLGGTYCVARVLFGPAAERAGIWWLVGGACGGMACLSKLHGVFLFAGTLLFLLTTRTQRRWLRTPWPYLGAGLACVLFLPVIIWNVQHGWVSFAFQGGRVRWAQFDPGALLVVLAGQAVWFLPWLWMPLVVSLVRASLKGPRDERDWLLCCLALGPSLLFTLPAVFGTRILFHWAAPGYLFAFALLGRDLADSSKGLSRPARVWLISTATSLVVLVASAMALAKLPWPPVQWPGGNPPPYPLNETTSWSDLRLELSRRGLLDRPDLFIAATRWHEAGRIDLAMENRLPVRCLCADARGYRIIYRNSDHVGQDALIVGQRLSKERVNAAYGPCFKDIEELAPVTIYQGGAPLIELQIFHGRRFGPTSSGSVLCARG
jgi:4-amino-4-deoxy-L-arabinose transferase-like glycosyltransferase